MRFDATATPIWQYSDEVMRRLDRNWDGRVEVNDPFLSFRTQNFLRMADRNMDNTVDRWELENEIAWRVDRNMDRRIDENERRDAWMQFDLPARGRDPMGDFPRHRGMPAVAVRF
jgi:hypothetical protein